MNIIEGTDPNRIYIENIRSFYNIPFSFAKFFCELAVRENVFKRRIAVNCPECGRVIMHVSTKVEIPDTVKCDTCELLEKNKFEFHTTDKDWTLFYQLNDNDDVK